MVTNLSKHYMKIYMTHKIRNTDNADEHLRLTGGGIHPEARLRLSSNTEPKKKLKMAERGYSFSLTTFR